ncbi:FG-GAP repeat domain-containing protein [Desulfosudis oleivorans]|uniref:FG-GAP repeat protein n=1 Tax=Desulfosudis oleivorans (strain DSM 6200 / JCM 39069 / Hxd3) TaxID=96561 RepID=A9A0T5_DESOH|nr:VCBS repeat-containing protein [Desulfosudis oleivorans]ABW67560.1 FG-GAP repeat protein [Desulfosudis oleivorans Hxd3]
MKQTTPRIYAITGHDKNFMPFSFMAKSAATLSLAGLVFAASPAHEAVADIGPFELKFRQDNPLMLPAGADSYSRPALADIDDDGDLDLFVGTYEGTIYYFENIGTDTAADFEMRIGEDNPFWYANTDTTIEAPYLPYNIGSMPSPAFSDLDSDGDLDAFVGEGYGVINYFENTGTASAPLFTERTGSDAPSPFWVQVGTSTDYNQAVVGGETTPAFVDIDADGDMDLFVGVSRGGSRSGQEISISSGEILFFENTGPASAPAFVEYNSDGNPLDGYSGDYSPTPVFVDIDGDGDMDAFVGSDGGSLYLYRNIGTAQSPEFEEQGGDDGHPLDNFDAGSYSAPVFGDMDGDGDMDALIGNGEGFVHFMKNTGTDDDPAFTELQRKASPTWGFDVGGESAPAFVDIDGDGDMDAFAGSDQGYIYFMRNTGTANDPVFNAPAGFDNPDNPFYGVDDNWDSAPAFVDIDGDGDMDAFVGTANNSVNYFKNIGTASAPDFVKMPLENPLADYAADTYRWAPVFADIDGDGDMDAFNFYDALVFYENIGTATAPDFTFGLPLAEVTTGDEYGFPAFVDADGDGDLDLVVGTPEGAIHYFENTGTADEPFFTELTGTDHPLADYLLYLEEGVDDTAPTFVDIDGDGDMDLFVGEAYGRFLFFENTEIEGTGGGTTPAVASDDDTCFIQTASQSKAGFSPLQTVKNIYASLVSFLR